MGVVLIQVQVHEPFKAANKKPRLDGTKGLGFKGSVMDGQGERRLSA